MRTRTAVALVTLAVATPAFAWAPRLFPSPLVAALRRAVRVVRADTAGGH